ncbi:MAG: hypothetical protein QXN45_00320 [Candidatus Thermoplasmatota archaeon]
MLKIISWLKQKLLILSLRYFFFLFMSLLYNLWYFIRIDYSITAEEWKDLIEDEFIVGNYALEIMLDMIIQLKLFYYSFLLQLQDYLMLLFFKI